MCVQTNVRPVKVLQCCVQDFPPSESPNSSGTTPLRETERSGKKNKCSTVGGSVKIVWWCRNHHHDCQDELELY